MKMEKREERRKGGRKGDNIDFHLCISQCKNIRENLSSIHHHHFLEERTQ